MFPQYIQIFASLVNNSLFVNGGVALPIYFDGLERLTAIIEFIFTVERSPVNRLIPPRKVKTLFPAVQAIISLL